MAAQRPARDRPFLTTLTRDRSGRVVVALRGELDTATAGQLEETLRQLADSDEHDVVLDAARLTFCGARGVAVMVSGNSLLGRRGRRLTVRHASGHLRRVLVLLELGHLLDDAEPGEVKPGEAQQGAAEPGDVVADGV